MSCSKCDGWAPCKWCAPSDWQTAEPEEEYEYDWRATWWGFQYLTWRIRILDWRHRLKRWWRPMTDAQILAREPVGGREYLEWMGAKMRQNHAERQARKAKYANLVTPEQVVDRNKMFALTAEQWARHDEWVKETREIRLQQQRELIERGLQSDDEDEREYAELLQDMGDRVYDGAVGGAYTYTFLPTSVGTLVTVKESRTDRELVLDENFG